jgi:oxygen-independent coproporphyrinogen-3 oxidase
MDALEIQLKFELNRFNVKENSIETIFIGGGTPSTVSAELYQPIFQLLKPYLKKNIEITSEANPNSATRTWLKGMKELGVNRISFGVQSFNKEKLRVLNRAHTPQMAKDAINNAKEVGFKNISLDIIYATLGDTKELLQNDLNEAFKLPINHISAYALTIEENTAFENKKEMSSEQLSLTSWLFEEIKLHGFEQYEISNFGDYKSSHNLGYWLYKDYIGIGAGAVGKLNLSRYYPNTNIEEYIISPNNITIENLTLEDEKIEKIFLGFRSCIGVDKNILNEDELKRAQILVDENKIEMKNGIFYNYNYLIADEIALFINS